MQGKYERRWGLKTFLCYEGVDVLRSIDRRKKDLMGRDDVCYVGSICECM